MGCRCESLAELIWTNRQHIKDSERLTERLKQKLSLDPLGTSDMSPKLMTDLTQLLSTLVTSTFIIEKQPPQVMKTNTRYIIFVLLVNWYTIILIFLTHKVKGLILKILQNEMFHLQVYCNNTFVSGR